MKTVNLAKFIITLSQVSESAAGVTGYHPRLRCPLEVYITPVTLKLSSNIQNFIYFSLAHIILVILITQSCP